MLHEMLTQRALFCIDSNTKKGTLSQQFVTHVAPLVNGFFLEYHGCGLHGHVNFPCIHVSAVLTDIFN